MSENSIRLFQEKPNISKAISFSRKETLSKEVDATAEMYNSFNSLSFRK
jgi:hypothetical protein